MLNSDDTEREAKASLLADQLKVGAPGGHTSENVSPIEELPSTAAATEFNGARPGVRSLTSLSAVSLASSPGARSTGLSDMDKEFEKLQEQVHRKRTRGMT